MRMANMAGTTAFLAHVVLGLVLINSVNSASEGKQSVAEGRWDMTLAIERLLHHYDLRIRPNFRGAPVKVGVLVDVISIDSISDVNMEYTVSYDIRQSWVDERLDFRHLYDGEKMTFEGETTLRIWRPDTFIKNGRGSRFHDVTIGQQLMHIFKNGSVIYKLRLTTTASCWMKMHMYPLDAQNCTLQFETYGYTTEDLVYYWLWGFDSVRGFENVELPHFDLGGYDTHETAAQYTTGQFSGLALSFVIRRNMGYFISETYLPSCLVVAVSWVSFWISPDASAARVLLGIMTVLTMTNLDATVRQGLPKISYVKAIDVYLVGCLIFVFGALLEYAAVNYHYHTATMKRRKKEGVRRKWRRLAYSRSFQEEQNGDLMEMGRVQPAGGIIHQMEDSDDSDDIVDLTSTGKIRRRLRVMDFVNDEDNGGDPKDIEIIEETIERTTAPKKVADKEVNCASRSRLNETTIRSCGGDCCPDCKTPFGIEKIPGVKGIKRKGPHRYYVDVADVVGHSYSKFARKHGVSFGRRYPDADDVDDDDVRTITGNGRIRSMRGGEEFATSDRFGFVKAATFPSRPRRAQSEKRRDSLGNAAGFSGNRRRNSMSEDPTRNEEPRRNSFMQSLDMGRLGWFRTFGGRLSLSEITERLIKDENVNRIDKISRIMFPFTFVVLNIIYWAATYA
ncbi:hypothetical protein Bbelb_012230 [Branchiostoma belcheri]|nr:hypothetical protein Bbelb_012230 [Branchiostoma belcheri]